MDRWIQRGKGKVGWIERIEFTHTHTLPCGKQLMGSSCIAKEFLLGALGWPRGEGWEGDSIGKGYKYNIADSLYYTTETNNTESNYTSIKKNNKGVKITKLMMSTLSKKSTTEKVKWTRLDEQLENGWGGKKGQRHLIGSCLSKSMHMYPFPELAQSQWREAWSFISTFIDFLEVGT